MSTETPVELVQSFLEKINRADVDGLAKLLTPDHTFVDALGNSVQGAGQMRHAWATYFQWFPDYRISTEQILQSGNTVDVFGTAAATYAPDGKLSPENRWETPAAWLAVVRDGKVAEWRVYADNQPARKLMGEAIP